MLNILKDTKNWEPIYLKNHKITHCFNNYPHFSRTKLSKAFKKSFSRSLEDLEILNGVVLIVILVVKETAPRKTVYVSE